MVVRWVMMFFPIYQLSVRYVQHLFGGCYMLVTASELDGPHIFGACWRLSSGSWKKVAQMFPAVLCKVFGRFLSEMFVASKTKNGKRRYCGLSGWLRKIHRNPAPVGRWFIHVYPSIYRVSNGFNHPSFWWCRISQPSTVAMEKPNK